MTTTSPTNTKLLWISRVAFLGLIIFELLNQFNILHFTLDFTWFGLALTSVVAWASLEIALRVFTGAHAHHFHFGAIFAVVAVMTYVDALGDILHLYSKISFYDQIAHFSGGAFIAIVFAIIIHHLDRLNIITLGRFAKATFIIALTALGGSLYEIEEYLEDYFRGSNRLGDGPDTANDIMLAIIAAVLVAAVADRIQTARSRNHTPNKN